MITRNKKHSMFALALAAVSLVGGVEAQAASSGHRVRIVYLVPSDKPVNPAYVTGIKNGMLAIQDWYRQQLGNGKTFQIDDRMVEVVRTNRPAWGYANDNAAAYGYNWVVWYNADRDARALIPGYGTDPEIDWVVYVDADNNCGQNAGGGVQGVTIMNAPDLRGLAGVKSNPICIGGANSTYAQGRWIGGLAHEFGHSLGLPHPPGCDSGASSCDYGALMWSGYANYPNTYLRTDDKTALNSSAFISIRPIADATYDHFEYTEPLWFSPRQQSWTSSNYYIRQYLATTSALITDLSNAVLSVGRGGNISYEMLPARFDANVKMINAAQLKSYSGVCARPNSGSSTDGTTVLQYSCTNAFDYYWKFQPVNDGSGAYQIINKASGKCLRAASGTSSTTQIATCSTAGTAAQWLINSSETKFYSLKNKWSAKCAAIPSKSNAVVESTCDVLSNSQKWEILRN